MSFNNPAKDVDATPFSTYLNPFEGSLGSTFSSSTFFESEILPSFIPVTFNFTVSPSLSTAAGFFTL